MKQEKISIEEKVQEASKIVLYKQALEICKDFIYNYSTAVANIVGDIIQRPSLKKVTDLELEHDKFFSNQEEDEESPSRMSVFGDQLEYMVAVYYIFSVKREYTEDGKPCIKLNEVQEDVSLKDNPIRNVILIYDNEQVCCRDFDRLRNRLNKWKKK